MDQKIITQLNQLNTDFYNQIASDFSDTRSVPWEGWQKLLPYLNTLASQKDQKLNVLDIGCGNGRFFTFLNENLSDSFNYWGVDNSQELLKLIPKNTDQQANFSYYDVIEGLLNETLVTDLQKLNSKFEVITLFGVLHHIPSFKLRQKLIHQLQKLLTKNGTLIITAWQFTDSPNLLKRAVSPEKIGLKNNDLETNDYILDWQRGNHNSAFRYAHLTIEQEMTDLIQGSNLKIKDQYLADKYNHYYLLVN
jgi:tRNA (uracil-5-)-methyltransferase TRM9